MNLEKGAQVSHYRLVDRLGVGGMGVVYSAVDLKLDRLVALKFLPLQMGVEAEEKERFIREAKMTSSLDHPNICTIYEVNETKDGVLFIAMAHYGGETLDQKVQRGQLAVEEAVEIISQVCAGLAKAHDRGIIHRDIKPENIILTEDRILKIVDFGVSKLKGTSKLTRPGFIVGTPAYMSPELIQGERVDQRSDLWSVGVLLYHLLTCQLPFTGDNEFKLLHSIVHDEPRPLSLFRTGVPAYIEEVLDRALEKNPEKRFSSATEMGAAVVGEQVSVPTVGKGSSAVVRGTVKTPSLAVLPFRDLSPRRDQEYLCEGLAEALITTMCKLPELRVASRNAAFRLKDSNLDTTEIGQKLGVETVLEGSVQRIGDQLRISYQLVNVGDDFVIWADELRREMKNIFEIQDELSEAIVSAFKFQLTDTKKGMLAQPRTDDVEAYTAYLKGRFHWNRRTVDAVRKSISFFTEAIDSDPQYAPAHAGLADAYTVLGIYSAFPPGSVMPRAKAAAERALDIDDRLAEAHISKGCVTAVFDWNWNGAERSFRRGIELNPQYALGHHWFCINQLAPRGRFDEALEEIELALRFDPTSPVIAATKGLVRYFSQDYARALDDFESALEIDREFSVTHHFLGRTYLLAGEPQKGYDSIKKALAAYGENPNMLASLVWAAVLAEDHNKAQQILDQLIAMSGERYVSSYDIASAFLALGEKEQTISWLRKAVEERSYLLVYVKVDPLFESLRELTEFEDLVGHIFGSG